MRNSDLVEINYYEKFGSDVYDFRFYCIRNDVKNILLKPYWKYTNSYYAFTETPWEGYDRIIDRVLYQISKNNIKRKIPKLR